MNNRLTIACPHCFWLFEVDMPRVTEGYTIECPRNRNGCCGRKLFIKRLRIGEYGPDTIRIRHLFRENPDELCCSETQHLGEAGQQSWVANCQ